MDKDRETQDQKGVANMIANRNAENKSRSPAGSISDTDRMDWLVSMTVDVRTPCFYGSHSLFWSQTQSNDDEKHHTSLREQIDAEIRKGD